MSVSPGAGVRKIGCSALLYVFLQITLLRLSYQVDIWGKAINDIFDETFILWAHLPTAHNKRQLNIDIILPRLKDTNFFLVAPCIEFVR